MSPKLTLTLGDFPESTVQTRPFRKSLKGGARLRVNKIYFFGWEKTLGSQKTQKIKKNVNFMVWPL